jgi:hypothetical protein
LNRQLSDYYAFLGKSVFLGHDRKFWHYHRTKLNDMGVGFDWLRLAGAAMMTVVNSILNPKDSFEKAMKRAQTAESHPPSVANQEVRGREAQPAPIPRAEVH